AATYRRHHGWERSVGGRASFAAAGGTQHGCAFGQADRGELRETRRRGADTLCLFQRELEAAEGRGFDAHEPLSGSARQRSGEAPRERHPSALHRRLGAALRASARSEEHTSELQSREKIAYRPLPATT